MQHATEIAAIRGRFLAALEDGATPETWQQIAAEHEHAADTALDLPPCHRHQLRERAQVARHCAQVAS